MLLAIWYDLSDVKLAEALDDRASFRRFCGFSRSEATPERSCSPASKPNSGRNSTYPRCGESPSHVWTAPFLQVEKVSFGAVGCSHVSGLDVRRTYDRGP